MREYDTTAPVMASDAEVRQQAGNSPLRIIYNDDELLIADNLRELSNIKDTKVTFNIILHCLHGEAQFYVNDQQVGIRKGQIFFCHSHVTLSHILVSPDFNGAVTCVSDHLLKIILQTQISIWNRILYQRHYYLLNYIRFSSQFEHVGDAMRGLFVKMQGAFKQDILVSLLRAAFLMICERFIEEEEATEPSANRSSRMDTLFQRFLSNLSRRSVKKVSVNDYAAELCITPKYLSAICRKVSGKPPVDWINEAVLADAKQHLRSTDLPVKEIATRLGFRNFSFFCRYFRYHLGVSPAEFRKQGSNNG